MIDYNRDLLEAVVHDLVADFLWYDREDDEDLPRDAIEVAIAGGDTTIDEIVGMFRDELVKRVSE